MITTDYQTRVHIAGEPVGAKQDCSRCGANLVNTEGMMAMTGQTYRLWWTIGAFVGVCERVDGRPLNPVGSVLMDHDACEFDEIACGSRLN